MNQKRANGTAKICVRILEHNRKTSLIYILMNVSTRCFFPRLLAVGSSTMARCSSIRECYSFENPSTVVGHCEKDAFLIKRYNKMN